jgi:hypothetical protein
MSGYDRSVTQWSASSRFIFPKEINLDHSSRRKVPRQRSKLLDEADLNQLVNRNAHAGHLGPSVLSNPHEHAQNRALEDVVAILQQAELLLANNLQQSAVS